MINWSMVNFNNNSIKVSTTQLQYSKQIIPKLPTTTAWWCKTIEKKYNENIISTVF